MAQSLKLTLVEDFLPNDAELFASLRDSVDWETSMSSRHTASYGAPYAYSQMTYPARPLLPELTEVAQRLYKTLGIEFNNCLLNYYLSGASTMGFHSDDTAGFLPGTGVAIVSLGSTRAISYRCKADYSDRRSLDLPSGSMLYMDADVQEHWAHAIRKDGSAGPRISLTWRAIELAEL